jgi:hypothetical protein
MPSFSKKILVPNQGNAEFQFDRIYTTEDIRYFVRVHRNSKYYHFNMHQRDGLWIIVNTEILPDWILELEVELANSILNH